MGNTNQFDLIENAKESLEHAVGHLTRTNPADSKDIKRAILDITHVIELLLKAALYNIHPSFVWEKIDDYPDEEKRTVTSDLALIRLIKLGDVGFKEETKETIKSARKIRNQIEHFKFEIQEKQGRFIIGRLLSFIFDFSNRRLGLDWETEFRSSQPWKSLIRDIDFWNSHSPIVEQRMLKDKKTTVRCFFCRANTFNMETGECELCSFKEPVNKCITCKRLYPLSRLEEFDAEDDSPTIKVCFDCL